MDFLNGKIKSTYFKYLSAAFFWRKYGRYGRRGGSGRFKELTF